MKKTQETLKRENTTKEAVGVTFHHSKMLYIRNVVYRVDVFNTIARYT